MRCLAFVAIVSCACATTTAAPPPPTPAPAPAPALEPTHTPAPPAPERLGPGVQRSPGGPIEPLHERQLPGAIWPPPGYVEPKCELELSTSVKRRGKVYELTAIAKNISDRPLSFELPDRCPQGPIAFAGLPEGYDYYRSCTKGACAGPRKAIPISVAAGASVELASVEIDPVGANCNESLQSGRYSFSFGLAGPLRTCSGTFGSFEHKAPATRLHASPPPAPTAECPPMPACGIACPSGRFARDKNGCAQCGCEKLEGIQR